MVRRILVLGYGGFAYLVSLAAFAYIVGFLAGAVVPKGIDDGPAGPVGLAVVVDSALVSLFAVQHSVMARPWFKRWWTRLVPPALERSTYILLTSVALLVLAWQWRPLPAEVWSVDTGWLRVGLWALHAAGWTLVLLSTFSISHADLFGLRQVLARARATAYREVEFREPWLYRLVRHPLLVGFLVAFWATPDMSAGRLLFAGLATGYILVAVRLEEADLRRDLGDAYRRYAERVPRFVPQPSAFVRRDDVQPEPAHTHGRGGG